MAALNTLNSQIAHPEALAPSAQALALRFGERSWSGDFYLAGSAALALYLGHRPVADLDLMAGTCRLVPTDRRDLLADLVAIDPTTEVETARDGYLFVRMARENGAAGTAVRFHYYPYPLVEPFEDFGSLDVASAIDLGLMKLGAIISRGARRDFVDLFLLRQLVPLGVLLGRAEDKFGHVRDFPLQALKGLADRSAITGEPMPRLAHPLEWAEVEAWLDEEVRSRGRQHVGLGASA